jgi:hypothetical protein
MGTDIIEKILPGLPLALLQEAVSWWPVLVSVCAGVYLLYKFC